MSLIEDESVDHVTGAGAPETASRADLMAARRSLRLARARQRRRRLVRRTLVPLCCLVALGAIALALVSSSGAGSRTGATTATMSPARRRPAPPPVAPAPVTRAAQGAVGGPGAPLPVPTRTVPLRVLVVGDGLAGDVGTALAAQLAPNGLVDVTVDSRPGSGLVRAAPVDWFANLADDLAADDPELVVVVLGSNDREPITTASSSAAFGTATWLAAYETLVRRFAEEATASGARVLWIGMPAMASAALSSAMQELDGVYQDAALSVPGELYLASWSLLASPSGLYTAALQDASGASTTVRSADGELLTPAGAAMVSEVSLSAIDAGWQLHLRP